MKEKVLSQAKREHSTRRRLVALFIAGLFFLGAIPFLIFSISSSLDQRYALPRLGLGTVNEIAGWLFVVAGLLFANWSIFLQFTVGRGTPIPIMATQKLIVQGPYNYCRNPMALGSIVLYLGIAFLFGSLSAVGLVLLGTVFLLGYIKLVEERELEARFGQEYLEYKKRSPFIFPRLRRVKNGI